MKALISEGSCPIVFLKIYRELSGCFGRRKFPNLGIIVLMNCCYTLNEQLYLQRPNEQFGGVNGSVIVGLYYRSVLKRESDQFCNLLVLDTMQNFLSGNIKALAALLSYYPYYPSSRV
uniref:Uncharacterized protein n=1 Tax=Romanomermis culicivorax TaxID=13658 RepID=A0A915JK90_ROMCU